MKTKIENIRKGRCSLPGTKEICGDMALFTHLPDESIAFILSDGMGKGRPAFEESRRAAEQLKRFLREDMPAASAIKAVNKSMVESKRGGCSFATVDLTIVEAAAGRARFYKMGAATSFLVRGNRVKRIEHPALPVGIVPKLKLRAVAVDIRPGDIILMVSDGITESDRNDLAALWLQEALSHIPDEWGPVTLSEAIVELALENYGRRERDDLTAMAIMID